MNPDLRDPLQFNDAYRRLAPVALASAKRVLRDEAAAEDVVQDVFMQLWLKPSIYDPARGSLSSYVSMLVAQPRPRPLAHPHRPRRRGRARRASSRACSSSRPRALPSRSSAASARSRCLARWTTCRATSATPCSSPTVAASRRRRSRACPDVPLGTAKSRVRLGLRKARATLQAQRRSVPDELTIREVARQTGVPEGTLRMWETRYGFPVPERLPSGHRRYSRTTCSGCARCRATARPACRCPRRSSARARWRASRSRRSSPGVRRRRPDLQPYLLAKRTLIGLSHAIEDECAARAERPVLFASFQRERFYRDAEPRWRELARTSETRSCSPTSRASARPHDGPSSCRSTATTRSAASGRSSATPPLTPPSCPPGSAPARTRCPTSSAASRPSGAWSRGWCARRAGSPPGSWSAPGRTCSTRSSSGCATPRRRAARSCGWSGALTNRMVAYVGAGGAQPAPSTALILSGVTPSDSASALPRGLVIGISISSASSQVANALWRETASSRAQPRVHHRQRHVQEPPLPPPRAQRHARDVVVGERLRAGQVEAAAAVRRGRSSSAITQSATSPAQIGW